MINLHIGWIIFLSTAVAVSFILYILLYMRYKQISAKLSNAAFIRQDNKMIVFEDYNGDRLSVRLKLKNGKQ